MKETRFSGLSMDLVNFNKVLRGLMCLSRRVMLTHLLPLVLFVFSNDGRVQSYFPMTLTARRVVPMNS